MRTKTLQTKEDNGRKAVNALHISHYAARARLKGDPPAPFEMTMGK